MGARAILRACVVFAALAVAGAGADLYKTLGVKREEATPQAIKAAYKKAALRFHPDRQVGKDAKTQKAAEAKFKDAARAYEVLSDAEKRKVYDRFGEDGLKAKEQGADMSGPFAGAYGGGGGGFGGGFGGAPAGFGGGFSPFGAGGGVSFGGFPGGVRFSMGGDAGAGAAGLDDLLGMRFGQRPAGGGGGGGFGGGGFGSGGVAEGGRRAREAVKPIELSCSLAQVHAGCAKKLKVTLRGVSTYVTVTVPPGARPGARLTARSAEGEGALPAGVRFVLRELPHPWLERAGDDLIWRCALSREQASAKKGVRLKMNTLDGRELTISTKGLRVRDGARHVVRGEGMPVAAGEGGASKARGDLIIVFAVRPPREPVPVSE